MGMMSQSRKDWAYRSKEMQICERPVARGWVAAMLQWFSNRLKFRMRRSVEMARSEYVRLRARRGQEALNRDRGSEGYCVSSVYADSDTGKVSYEEEKHKAAL